MQMIWKLLVAVGMATTLGLTGSAALAQSPELLPIGSWDLQRTAESCYLARSFEGDAGKMRLRFHAFGPSTPYHIVVTGDGLPLRDQRSEAVQIGFGGPQAAKTVLGVVAKAGGQPIIVTTGYSSRPTNLLGWIYSGTQIELGAPINPAAETLYVDAVDMEPVTLRLGAMEAEFARLDECAQTLEDQWVLAASGGARPASQPTLIQGKEANWRTKYPENLLLNRISGLVQIRMTVDADGRARDCVVQASIWAKRFGDDACANLQRWARFEPARDANGKPIRALYRTAAVFAIYNWRGIGFI